MQRTVSGKFLDDLKSKDGMLSALTDYIRNDDTLMLALRGTYINVYYRGGNILKLTEKRSYGYHAYFNDEYDKNEKTTQKHQLPLQIKYREHLRVWLDAIPFLKRKMDVHFANNPKSEREFQQMAVWENNRSRISRNTEYFITDIEYAASIEKEEKKKNPKLDMLGIKWILDGENSLRCYKPVFFEVKYGSNSFEGSSGIEEHLRDLNLLLGDVKIRDNLRNEIFGQFRQLQEIGLLPALEDLKAENAMFQKKPEVVFLLANHDPKETKKLISILCKLKTLHDPNDFDLRFFVAGFAGYAMHAAYMVTCDDLIKRLSSFGS